MATVPTLPSEAADERSSAPLKSREEMLAIFRAARAEVQAANPTGRDLFAEFLAERRVEAANESCRTESSGLL